MYITIRANRSFTFELHALHTCRLVGIALGPAPGKTLCMSAVNHPDIHGASAVPGVGRENLHLYLCAWNIESMNGCLKAHRQAKVI